MRRRSILFDDWLKGQLDTPARRRRFERESAHARIAVRIAELREQKGLSQAVLARRMRTTQQAVSDIETLKHANVTLLTLERLAEALGSRLVVEFR
jgi:ribosome-binding protein aMBF1 (putative translation factor)